MSANPKSSSFTSCPRPFGTTNTLHGLRSRFRNQQVTFPVCSKTLSVPQSRILLAPLRGKGFLLVAAISRRRPIRRTTRAADLQTSHTYPTVPACRHSSAFCLSSVSPFLPPHSAMVNRNLFHLRRCARPSVLAARSHRFPVIGSTISLHTFTSRM